MNKLLMTWAVLLLSACASGPKPTDWQLNAKGAIDRAVAAHLEGNNRVEAAEMAKARSDISSTGRVDLMARAELLACASRVASLVFEPCAGFEKLRQDAAPAEKAYADYLNGKLQLQDAVLLPKNQNSPVASVKDFSHAVTTEAPRRRGREGLPRRMLRPARLH